MTAIDDLISRAAAIDAIDKILPVNPMKNEYTQGITVGAALATEYIKQLPSAQPECKTGKWLIRYFGDSGKCSVCGMYCGEYDLEDSDRYCRCCGAKMDGLKRIRSEEER